MDLSFGSRETQILSLGRIVALPRRTLSAVSQGFSLGFLTKDALFRLASGTAAASVLVLIAFLFGVLLHESWPSISKFGIGFLWSNHWNPVTGEFGALSSVFGTVVSTLIAMVLAVPASFFVAFFLTEVAPPSLAKPVGYAVELLAAIPSIIYGMWGLYVLSPIMAARVQPFLGNSLRFLPFFTGPASGIGMLTAGIILAIMIFPIMTAVTREVLQTTPSALRESAFGLGATTWEVTSKITLRHGAPGIVGGLFLGLGRALGETMAVTFVIGNNHQITASLFSPANTIASTLANEFAEASSPLYLSALTELGLILLLITLAVNTVAHLLLNRFHPMEGTR